MNKHDLPPIEGYQLCSNPACAKYVITEIWQRTLGYCTDCFTVKIDGSGARRLEIHNLAHRANIRTSPSKPKKKTGIKTTKKKGEKAKQRALKRLRHMFPDVYDIVYAEERAREGLDPWPLENLTTKSDSSNEVWDWITICAQLETIGVDTDGLADAPPNTKRNRRSRSR